MEMAYPYIQAKHQQSRIQRDVREYELSQEPQTTPKKLARFFYRTKVRIAKLA
jgi:hypothetical protein